MVLQWTPEVLADLARLCEFLAPVNRAAAASAVQDLTAAPERQIDLPRIGKRLHEFEPREVRRVMQMTNIDDDELEILRGCETGALRSVATQSELAKLKAAARATAIKDRRGYIRLSFGDLSDIQVKALEEGVPYQTLIASVLHKYVTGRLTERPVPRAKPRRSRASQRRSPTDD